jgi:hypothetical protein
MVRRNPLVLTVAFVSSAALFTAGRANGSVTYLVSDLSSTAQGPAVINKGQYVAGQFTLTAPGTTSIAIANIEAQGGNPPVASNLTAEIVSDSAGSPGSTVYAQSTAGTGTLSTSAYDPITFSYPSTTLAAGTYWLEVLHASTSTDGTPQWEATGPGSPPVQAGLDGTVGNLQNTNGGSYSAPYGLVFGITGTTAVPEPASLGLLAFGATALLGRRRKI